MDKKAQINLVTKDYLNAKVQYFKEDEKQQINFGVIIDDSFNIFFSSLEKNKLSGLTLAFFTQPQMILFGLFPCPQIVAMKCGNLTVYFSSVSLVAVIDEYRSLFYVLEQKEGKTKIVDRILLKEQYALPVHSKYIRNAIYNTPVQGHTVSESNLIRLLAAVFQLPKQVVKQIPAVTLQQFLKHFQTQEPRLQIATVHRKNHCQQLFIGMADHKHSFYRFGILLDKDTFKTKAVGSFNSKLSICGTGFIRQKNQTYIGVFKDDAMVREFSYDKQKQIKLPTTSWVVQEILKQQHLRSLHFQHQVIYFSELTSFVKRMNQIVAYIQVFQQQYSIRNESFSSVDTEEMYLCKGLKYASAYTFNLQAKQISSVTYQSPLQISSRESRQVNLKKPGFILKKLNGRQKSPQLIGKIINKSPIKIQCNLKSTKYRQQQIYNPSRLQTARKK